MDEKINNIKSRTKQAKLIGINTPKNVDWGKYSSKICGSVGGATDDISTKTDEEIVNIQK